MGTSFSTAIKDHTVTIETKDAKIFQLSYYTLVEHSFLLRKVVRHPEMTKKGRVLDHFIQDYCQRMYHGQMKTKDQQSKLPWQIEWICHVHRLHSLDYLTDCKEQLADGIVDKQGHDISLKHAKTSESKRTFLFDNNERGLFHKLL